MTPAHDAWEPGQTAPANGAARPEVSTTDTSGADSIGTDISGPNAPGPDASGADASGPDGPGTKASAINLSGADTFGAEASTPENAPDTETGTSTSMETNMESAPGAGAAVETPAETPAETHAEPIAGPPAGTAAETGPETAPQPSPPAGMVAARPSASALRDLAAKGEIGPEGLENALRLIGARPQPADWQGFFRQILTLFGALMLAGGVLFFFAANWAGMHHFARFGVVFACIAAGVGIALARGLDSLAGRVSLLFAGLMVGPLFAVYGQTYQTGAELWELFRAWALLLAVLALAARQAALWLVFWLVGSLAWLLWLGHGSPELSFACARTFLFLAPQGVALLVWEAAARKWDKRQPWLCARWFPRLLAFCLCALLTWSMCEQFFFRYHYASFYDGADGFAAFLQPLLGGLYLVVLAAGWFWYRKKRPDLFMLGCGVLSVAIVVIGALARSELLFFESVFTLLLWGVLIAGLTAGAGKLLHFWHQSILREHQQDDPAHAESTIAASWDAIWQHLRALELLGPDDHPQPPSTYGAPWYVLVIQALGGWVASLLLLAFLALFLAISMNVGGEEEFKAMLLGGGVLVLFIGTFTSRIQGVVGHQFGLATTLAGAGAVSVSLALMTIETPWWPLAAACGACAAYPLARSASFRLIAATAAFCLLHLWVALMLWGHSDWLFYGLDSQPSPGMDMNQLTLGGWWLGLSLALGWAWANERLWSGMGEPARMLPPALHGLFLSLLAAAIAASTLLFWSGDEFLFLLPGMRTLGVAAGGGIAMLAFYLTRTAHPAVRGLCLGAAALALVIGWFVPGVSLALFGLALGRYIGVKVYTGISGAFLFCYLAYHYYTLAQSLLSKSFSLMGVGVVLLLLGLALPGLLDRLARLAPRGGHSHA